MVFSLNFFLVYIFCSKNENRLDFESSLLFLLCTVFLLLVLDLSGDAWIKSLALRHFDSQNSSVLLLLQA